MHEARRGRFISLRLQLLIGFTLVFSIVFAAAYYWFYSFASNMALQRVANDMIDTLNGAIAGIDAEAFAALAAVEVAEGEAVPEENPLYRQHQDWLTSVHTIEPRSIPYTFVPGEAPFEVLWIGDIFRVVRPEDGTDFRESYINPESSIYGGLTELTLSIAPYTDPWGSWVSAYGPIRNAAGEPVGAVGIDFRADYVLEVQRGIRDSIFVSFAVTYGSLFLLVYLISGFVTYPLIRLAKMVEKVGEGDYAQDFSQLQRSNRRNEIGILAEVFQAMVDKVYQREQKLKREVLQLKIEIDEAKRQKQVSEIVESDFFKDLQGKAKRIRERDAAKTKITDSG